MNPQETSVAEKRTVFLQVITVILNLLLGVLGVCQKCLWY